MLEDFILANKLAARVFENEDELSTPIKQAKACGLPIEDAARTTLLINAESMEAVLAVFLAPDVLSIEKVEKASGVKNLKLADNGEALEITGYEKDFLPPVSIYGVKTIVDKKLASKKLVSCPDGDEHHAVSITPAEIIEQGYDAKIAVITES